MRQPPARFALHSTSLRAQKPHDMGLCGVKRLETTQASFGTDFCSPFLCSAAKDGDSASEKSQVQLLDADAGLHAPQYGGKVAMDAIFDGIVDFSTATAFLVVFKASLFSISSPF